MPNPIRLAVTGAAGRMGQRIIALSAATGNFQIIAALERAGHPDIGKPIGGVPLSASLDVDADVLIDFSAAISTRHWLSLSKEKHFKMVIGTTGLESADQNLIDEAASRVAILQAPNMSLVVNVLLRVVGNVAASLGEMYDIEISETHHRFKKDAPSGTALELAREICKATGKDYDKAVVFDRHGDDCPRQQGDIGMHAQRLGDNTGEHTVSFGGEGEGLQLRHYSTSRDSYALGALKAASFIAEKPPGRYSMADVLGLGGKK